LTHATVEQKLLVHRNLAMLELDRSRPEFAEPHARKAVELDNGPEQQLLLGRCLLALGRGAEASVALKISLQSENSFVRHQSQSLLLAVGG